jgi:hypothetical protein
MKRLDPRFAVAATQTGTARSAGVAPATTPAPQPATQPATGMRHEPAARGLPAFETASWEVASGEYVARVRETLEDLIDLSDCSQREVQRILNAHGCGLDMNRLLSGKFNLKLSQVLDVCRAIGVHPMELLRLVLKEPRTPSPIIARMAALFGPGTPLPIAPPAPARAAEPSQIQEIELHLSALQRQLADLRRRPPGTHPVTPNPPPDRRP